MIPAKNKIVDTRIILLLLEPNEEFMLSMPNKAKEAPQISSDVYANTPAHLNKSDEPHRNSITPSRDLFIYFSNRLLFKRGE